MRNNFVVLKETLLLLGACTLAFAVSAQDTVGDLSRIQGETLILKAKVSRATAQADLDSRGRTAFGEGDIPLVKSVTGIGGKKSAVLIYSSGATVTVKEGDAIAGGYTVASLAIGDVWFSKAGKTFKAGFLGQGSPAQANPMLNAQRIVGAPMPAVR